MHGVKVRALDVTEKPADQAVALLNVRMVLQTLVVQQSKHFQQGLTTFMETQEVLRPALVTHPEQVEVELELLVLLRQVQTHPERAEMESITFPHGYRRSLPQCQMSQTGQALHPLDT
jgi:hypothetical protein